MTIAAGQVISAADVLNGLTAAGEAWHIRYGLDAAKPAVPAVGDAYVASDTHYFYVCFVAAAWTVVNPAVAVGSNPVSLYVTTTEVTVGNTAVETNLIAYALAGGTLGTDGTVRLRMWIDHFNNSGVALHRCRQSCQSPRWCRCRAHAK